MKNSRSPSRTDTWVGKVIDQFPTFIIGFFTGSLITVYGTLTQIDLLSHLNADPNILNFYQQLLGLSNDISEQNKQYRGYIEKLNISVNPNTLIIHVLPNSICESAISEGDRVQVLPPVEVIGQQNSAQDTEFNLFKQRINQIISDGFGSIEVVTPENQLAQIEINLLNEEQNCVRKPKYIQELEKLLEQKKWKAADQKTNQVLLKITNRESVGYLDEDAIQKMSCSYLRTIDQLWKKYSGGLFGFSVQKRIFVETENQLKEDALNRYDPNAYIHFTDLVRWIESGKNGKEKWKNYNELTFSLEAPEGHLPRLNQLEKGMKMESNYQLFSPNALPLSSQEIKARTLFFARVDTCKL
ncbi:Mg-protoporphyrin IX methyl transferase (Modular protein) [Planktothrix tepida]|uniref:Mg-protoporphyrin IX methyl transferase (Modular protein) n=1 Tax=Planktothrix tepida PCC 9214 TaxID=671072 RepID=A0A1J1LKK3_9CYAN|nr:GUN4 domain-containing protein [Planktothrix tepida]CAD5952884.1 Mg-protoporphyrin IX methyl transferase (Modular protein) [Planktothrix tepida]CUR32718.1 Mg-protoporphyrin IX methyl transferase (modular protein) [Planktothrix tepida PCC 9214]